MGMGLSNSAMSAWVNTATTPSRASAAEASTPRMWAWECWLRRIAACSIPGQADVIQVLAGFR